MNLIRVLLVETDPQRRQTLSDALGQDPGLDVHAVPRIPSEGLQAGEASGPADVLVLGIDDLPMARARDWAAIHFLLPGVPIVALTMGQKGPTLFSAVAAGVLGLVRPDVDGSVLGRAVRRVHRGKVDRDPALVEKAERLLARPFRQRPVRFGGLLIDLDRQQVMVAGKPVRLTQLEFLLLAHLVRSRGRPVDWTELVEQVWGTLPGQGGTPDQVRGLIKRLRSKIAQRGAGVVLHNVRGRGYVLASPNEVAPSE